MFVDEFSVGKIPSTNGHKFYISSPRISEDIIRTRDRLKKLMRGLVVGENKPRYVLNFFIKLFLVFRNFFYFIRQAGRFNDNIRMFTVDVSSIPEESCITVVSA